MHNPGQDSTLYAVQRTNLNALLVWKLDSWPNLPASRLLPQPKLEEGIFFTRLTHKAYQSYLASLQSAWNCRDLLSATSTRSKRKVEHKKLPYKEWMELRSSPFGWGYIDVAHKVLNYAKWWQAFASMTAGHHFVMQVPLPIIRWSIDNARKSPVLFFPITFFCNLFVQYDNAILPVHACVFHMGGYSLNLNHSCLCRAGTKVSFRHDQVWHVPEKVKANRERFLDWVVHQLY